MAAPALLTTILVTLAPAKPPPTADASTVALTWRAPPACVDEHGGRALLRAYLGDTPIVDRPITVDITRRADGVFESTIAMDTDPPFATRTIASPRCDTLTRATALIIGRAGHHARRAERCSRRCWIEPLVDAAVDDVGPGASEDATASYDGRCSSAAHRRAEGDANLAGRARVTTSSTVAAA